MGSYFLHCGRHQTTTHLSSVRSLADDRIHLEAHGPFSAICICAAARGHVVQAVIAVLIPASKEEVHNWFYMVQLYANPKRWSYDPFFKWQLYH